MCNLEFSKGKEQLETKPVNNLIVSDETSTNGEIEDKKEDRDEKMKIEDTERYEHASLKHKTINYKIYD